jgi:hypothetical protein
MYRVGGSAREASAVVDCMTGVTGLADHKIHNYNHNHEHSEHSEHNHDHNHDSGKGTMSSFSSFFPTKLLGSINPRDRTADPTARLRFALETMPGSRKYVFTPATRAEIISELYDSFWGSYSHLFLPPSQAGLPPHATLSDVQLSLGFSGAGEEDPVIPGRPCGRICKKGEPCFRCK